MADTAPIEVVNITTAAKTIELFFVHNGIG
jgi:hypothetical protein